MPKSVRDSGDSDEKVDAFQVVVEALLVRGRYNRQISARSLARRAREKTEDRVWGRCSLVEDDLFHKRFLLKAFHVCTCKQ